MLVGCGEEEEASTEPLDEAAADVEDAVEGLSGEMADVTLTPADEDDAEEVSYTGEFVYVTEHGSKYHAPGCQHIQDSENLRKLTRDSAIEEGYEPCKVCNPGLPQ
ncbi:MAG: hypothetical protein GF403_02285 [Candidatus Coatesbacteria bacterium]|nr:hypothetical protein [Candidatus Coatesbacteria bacterium]